MTRKQRPGTGRLMIGLAAVAVGALVLAVALSMVRGAASVTSAVQPPRSLTPPAVTGLQVGQTLSATAGTYTGDSPMSFDFQWVRSVGSTDWAPIPGAKSSTYTLTPADIGHKLFVQVKATNGGGHDWNDSPTTTLVTGPTATNTVELPTGVLSVPVANIALPNQLVVRAAEFTPSKLPASGSVKARVTVRDAFGNAVRGVTVSAVALPFGAVQAIEPATTSVDGVATLTITASPRLADMNVSSIGLMVRAVKPGEHNPLAGVTGKRLLKLPLR